MGVTVGGPSNWPLPCGGESLKIATVTGVAAQDLDIATGDKGVFGFGPFLLDPVRRRLTLDGALVKPPPTQFDTLF
jgi:hypothetical protein